MKYKDFVKYWLPFLLYALLIFYLSSVTVLLGPDFVPEFRWQDKLFHVFEFFLFAFLALRLLLFYKVKNAYLFAVVVSVLYGITDEIHQLFVPGRFFSLFDILANAIGSLLIVFFRKK